MATRGDHQRAAAFAFSAVTRNPGRCLASLRNSSAKACKSLCQGDASRQCSAISRPDAGPVSLARTILGIDARRWWANAGTRHSRHASSPGGQAFQADVLHVPGFGASAPVQTVGVSFCHQRGLGRIELIQ